MKDDVRREEADEQRSDVRSVAEFYGLWMFMVDITMVDISPHNNLQCEVPVG